jgi:hypothetical protein
MQNFINPWDPNVNPPEWMKNKNSFNPIDELQETLEDKAFSGRIVFQDSMTTLNNDKTDALRSLGNVFNGLNRRGNIIVSQIKGGAYSNDPNLDLNMISNIVSIANARARIVQNTLNYTGQIQSIVPELNEINEVQNGLKSINQIRDSIPNNFEVVLTFMVQNTSNSTIDEINRYLAFLGPR